MAEMAVQGLFEFWPCKSVNNPNFGLPIQEKKDQFLEHTDQLFSNKRKFKD